jgi:hypothetical protein
LETEDEKRLQQLKNRLYYIEHKEEVNKNRKLYKRQAWSERKDNPKNKSKGINNEDYMI